MRRSFKMSRGSRSAVLLAAVLGILPVLPGCGLAENAAPVCAAPADLVRFNKPLARVAERIALGGPVTVVAIGSSSTAGFGASSVTASYPSRLDAALNAKLPGLQITVLNRGVNGEEIGDMLGRLDRGVIAERPDLVLWQFGTNAVLHAEKVASDAALIAEGLKRLKATGADVVLIDPQFAPKVIAEPDAKPIDEMISAAAKQGRVALFRRFAVIRYWHNVEHIPFGAFLDPDSLHMNDWGYDCMARLLANAIVRASTDKRETAHAPIPPG
jgi:acyl-CoA thioesterase-1